MKTNMKPRQQPASAPGAPANGPTDTGTPAAPATARATRQGGRYVGVVGADKVATAGASVWWECGRGVSRAALADAWDAAGLDPDMLPPDKSMEAALHDAVNTLSSARVFVRRAPGADGGWLLVAEREVASATDALTKARWDAAVHATLDKVGRLQVSFRDPANPDNAAVEAQLRAEYQRARAHLTGDEVTRWMGTLLNDLGGVLLRVRGGLWFVPGDELDGWHRVADVIAATTGTAIEEMTTVCVGDDAGRTVATIMSAVKRDAVAAVNDAMTAVSKGLDAGKPLGKRAMESQQRNLTAALAKVRRYEDALGVSLDELRSDIETVRAACAAHAIAASASVTAPSPATTGLGGIL